MLQLHDGQRLLFFKVQCVSAVIYNKTDLSQMESNIPVRQSYELINCKQRAFSMEGYQVPRNYVDPLKIIQDREMLKIKKGGKPRRRATKRGNFLDDQAKLHRLVPGPGKYTFSEEWPEKPKLKPRYSQNLTYIQEIIKQEKKEKRPGPGKYNLFKSQKEVEAQKKALSVKKIKQAERNTYLDETQVTAAQKPGVGSYNIRRRAKTEMSFSKYKTKPEQMRKKDEEQAKKKLPTQPAVTSYSPKPLDYTLFSTMSKARSKYWFGKSARFRATTQYGSGLNPAKYSIVQEWRSKGKKVERHGMEVLSKTRMNTSVYY